MTYEYLDYDQAHSYVAEQQRKGRAVFWDQWNIVSFRPNPAAFTKKDGMFHKGKWGTKRTIKVNKNGFWRVPSTNVAIG